MMAPEVVLINPKMCRPSGVRLPLSVLALGAALEGRYDYRIIDGNVDPDAVKNAVGAVNEGRCRAVGMTVMPGPASRAGDRNLHSHQSGAQSVRPDHLGRLFPYHPFITDERPSTRPTWIM